MSPFFEAWGDIYIHMNDYKDHIRRSMGLTESQFIPASRLKKEDFPGIGPGELGRDTEDQAISPTARPTPIIAIGIRGSVTGGLPSSADQTEKDISPTKVGGYDRVTPQHLNSKLVNKTPSNPDIKQETNPIVDNPHTGETVTHPHQIQVTAHEEPQNATGASTDSDPTLKLKSAIPKGIDVDIGNEGVGAEEETKNEDNNTAMIPSTSLSETFERHKRLMRERIFGLNEEKCPCGCEGTCQCPPDCKCKKKNKNGVCECATCGCGDPTNTHGKPENKPVEESSGKPHVSKKKYFDPKTK